MTTQMAIARNANISEKLRIAAKAEHITAVYRFSGQGEKES